MYRIFFFGILFCCTHFANGQNFVTPKTANKKAAKLFERAIQQSFNKQYQGALEDLNKALEIEPNFIDAYIEKANIEYDLGHLETAEKYFLRVLVLDVTYSKNTLYNLGLINWKLENYEKSANYFQRYLDSKANSSKRRGRAQNYLKNALFLAEAVKNPLPFHPVNLGLNINTARDEYLPSLTADENTLIYSVFLGSRVNGQEDFYMSKRVDGIWQTGKPVETVNTPDSEGAQSVSPDGRFLVFTACGRKGGAGSCDLYFTEFSCGKWTPVELMPRPISTIAWESQPSIAADGKTLFFSSDRKEGGIGGKDIWMSTRDEDGIWTEPTNLGPKINTKSDEKAPFIHPDGQTLYFLSNGHPGMGESDIFIVRKDSNGSWGEPQNIGYPINTKTNEGPIIVSVDGQTAYFSTNSKDYEGAQGKMDIYSFEMPESVRPQPVTYVKAKVKDDDTNTPISASVEIIDLETGKTLSKSKSDCNGEFLVTLPIGKNYMLNVSEEGYLFHSENFALLEKTSLAEPFLLKIDLIPIPKNVGNVGALKPHSKPIILKNVFFETGSAALQEISLIELNKLKRLLEKNRNLKIQINGHTDNVGEEKDNLTLSTNRAKAVHDYLVDNGILSNRLNFKGFGESTPIATNTTTEGRQENRRTEFVVL